MSCVGPQRLLTVLSAMEVGSAPYVILDVGSGYSKMGFAGNLQPTFQLPTVLATRLPDSSVSRSTARGLEDFDAFIGEDALNNTNNSSYSLSYPVRQSVIEDWDALERFYQHCLFHYLRVEPEDHNVLLAQPLGASAQTRQQLAEIMFETFGVAGVHLSLQAVTSLYGTMGIHRELTSLALEAATHAAAEHHQTVAAADITWQQAADRVLCHGLDPYSITGVVVDVGEGSTSVIPVMDGFVVRSSARSMGVGGRDLTQHVQQALRSTDCHVPPDRTWDTAIKIKERFCYVCSDPEQEITKPKKTLPKTYVITDARAGNKEITIPLGPELYQAPEAFFTCPPPTCGPPAGMSTGITNRTMGGWQPLAQLIDQVIQSCPIDARRPLYNTVTLSGGTACVRNFDRRVMTDLASIANARIPHGVRPIEVDVLPAPWAHYAAWLGGSLLAGGGASKAMMEAGTTTRQHWLEHGSPVDI